MAKKSPSRKVPINISISVSLKEKMDDLKKRKRVNWSRIASQAFHKYIRKESNTQDSLG